MNTRGTTAAMFGLCFVLLLVRATSRARFSDGIYQETGGAVLWVGFTTCLWAASTAPWKKPKGTRLWLYSAFLLAASVIVTVAHFA